MAKQAAEVRALTIKHTNLHDLRWHRREKGLTPAALAASAGLAEKTLR